MPTVVIKPGATVFVTGANGLIGSHVIDQLLLLGYNVRGAVRDTEKAKWLKEHFDGKYDKVKFEMVEVPDMTAEACYDDLLDGKVTSRQTECND
jgi:nucleoside-diphosphate-sugar epimerase